MPSKNINTRIQNKHDTEANWNSATNFKPLDGGIIVYDVDSNHPYPRYKVGDGKTVVTALPFSTNILDDYLPIQSNNSLVLKRTAYNIINWVTTSRPKEISIDTKIRWASGTYMPVIHLYGYAYGQQSPIEFKIGFYIYEDEIGWCGVTNMGAWAPNVLLYRRTDSDEIDYVSIALIYEDGIYYPQFSIDIQNEMGSAIPGGNIIELDGWSIRSSINLGELGIPSAGEIPNESCVQVPYKPIPGYVTDSSLSTSLSNYVTRSTEQIIYSHKTFNSTASGTLSITVTSNDVSNQMGMSSTAIWNFDPSTSKWYSASLQAKNGILAYTSDIPNTSNFITSTQLNSAIEGITIDDGIL